MKGTKNTKAGSRAQSASQGVPPNISTEGSRQLTLQEALSQETQSLGGLLNPGTSTGPGTSSGPLEEENNTDVSIIPGQNSEDIDGNLLGAELRSRRGSVSSQNSMATEASAMSMFSDRTKFCVNYFEERKEEYLRMYNYESNILKTIVEEITKMRKATEVQKNISAVVKDGIRNIDTRIQELMKERNDFYSQKNMAIRMAEDAREFLEEKAVRDRKRRRYQEQTIVRAFNRAQTLRQKESSESSPEKDLHKRKKNKKDRKTEPKKDIPVIVLDGRPPKAQPPRKHEAKLVVKVAQGQTFADVLKKIRAEFKPETCSATVLGAVQTAKGDVLLKLKGDSDLAKASTALDKVVEGVGKVAENKERNVTLEIRDLDSLTEEKDVEQAVEKVLGFAFQKDKRKVTLMRANRRQQRMALVTLGEQEAHKLEQEDHLRVGYLSCKIRRRVEVLRCFKCLEYGHTAPGCKNEDRSGLCFRCGTCNHRKKDCKSEPRCFLCKEDNKHEAGSGACGAFRRALELARNKLQANKR